MSLRRATTLFAVALVVGALRPARADDSSPPPAGFVVPVQSNDSALAPGADDVDTSDVDAPRHRRHAKKRSRAHSDDATSDDVSDDGGTAKPLSVVEEPDQAPTEVTPGELSSQHAGVPLESGKGLDLVAPVQPSAQGSFTFRASAAKSRPHRTRIESTAPESIVVPSSGTPSMQPPSNNAGNDVDDDDVVQGSTADSLLNLTQSGPSGPTPSAPAAPSTFIPPSTPPPSGSAAAIPIVQVPLQYRDETEIVVGAPQRHRSARSGPPAPQPPPSELATPTAPTEPLNPSADAGSAPVESAAPAAASTEAPSSAPAPLNEPAASLPSTIAPAATQVPAEPAAMPVVPEATPPAAPSTGRPATAAPAPANSDALDELPSPAGQAASTSAPQVTGSAGKWEDPFRKLDRDMRAISQSQPPADQGPPKPRAEVPPPQFHTSPFAEKPITVAPTPVPQRPPSLLGLSVLAGIGPAIMDGSTTGYATRLAYGLTATFNPTLAGPLAIDLSVFRATDSGGTPFVSVDSAWNDIAIRLLYLKWQPHQVFVGFGAGLLLTENSATYHVDDGTPTEATAAVLRPGVDGTSVVGIQLGVVQLRLDLRVLLRGGLRLDFLPTFSAGVGF